MDILESVKMATTTLLANKLRSSLTMLGIIIGNASVIAMIGIGEGAQKLATEQFESLGPNLLFIIPGSPESRNRVIEIPKTLVLEDAKAIAKQVRAIKDVAPEINTRTTITYRNKNSSSSIIGTTPNYLAVRSVEIEKGRFFNELDIKRSLPVVVLGPELARKLFGNQSPIGQNIRIKNVSFEVIGLTVAKGTFLGNNNDDIAFIPITTMSGRIVGRTSPYGIDLSLISVSAKDENSIRAAEFQLTNLLRLRHKITQEDDFTIRTQKNILDIISTITNGLTLMLAAIAGISLLVGGIGIMNIMLVSVTERTQEIGLRKAIGATQQDILIQFMIEAVILSIAGGILGIALGGGSVILISMVTPLEAGISASAVILAASVSGSIGLFFGVVPARRAAQLDPMVALRTA
ncbi:FtsX-like permease family protein [Anabaena sp. UHCC 0253]|uniref:ABC transporter permease n=1 Tax=Anabaena sp. UHCC 0253 TaxID=2590019 RepID=UPI0014478345|nr:ABC transporter permease [Anabaena sp. UHCC 0253]MTJ55551.1 FtsX-like permease family protein [Anabaena sp. UHCC 0253]